MPGLSSQVFVADLDDDVVGDDVGTVLRSIADLDDLGR